MSKYFANEADFHQRIIENFDTFPDRFRGAPSAKTLFWAHELTLHDAGSRGGNGSADLMTIDVTGMIWLIEVKFNFSAETGAQVWHNQLTRYRKALMSMSWTQIVTYTRQFLRGFETTKPQFPFRASTLSLEECFIDWLAHSNIDTAHGVSMVATLAKKLQTGDFGIMLVSNYASASYLAEARVFASGEHTGPVAYAVIDPEKSGFNWVEEFFRPAIDQSLVAAPYEASDFIAGKRPNITPSGLRTLVSPACCELLDTVIYPRLNALGWDPGKNRSKSDAFDAIIPVGEHSIPLLVVGRSERDAKALQRSAKIEGGHTLKINPRLKEVLNYTGNISFVNSYMKRYYELGWRGRPRQNKNLRWGVEDVSADEIRAAEGAMIYCPSEELRDHVGREGDVESLSKFFHVFEEMIASMPAATLKPQAT